MVGGHEGQRRAARARFALADQIEEPAGLERDGKGEMGDVKIPDRRQFVGGDQGIEIAHFHRRHRSRPRSS